MKGNFKDRISKACLKANEYNASYSYEIVSCATENVFPLFIYPWINTDIFISDNY